MQHNVEKYWTYMCEFNKKWVFLSLKTLLSCLYVSSQWLVFVKWEGIDLAWFDIKHKHVKRFSWGIMAKSTVNIIASVAPALQTNSGISYYLFQGRKPPSYHSRQIPPPKPPKTKKDDIFSLEKYQYVDDYVLNVSHCFHLYNSTTNQLGWYIYVYSHSVSFSFFFLKNVHFIHPLDFEKPLSIMHDVIFAEL